MSSPNQHNFQESETSLVTCKDYFKAYLQLYNLCTDFPLLRQSMNLSNNVLESIQSGMHPSAPATKTAHWFQFATAVQKHHPTCCNFAPNEPMDKSKEQLQVSSSTGVNS